MEKRGVLYKKGRGAIGTLLSAATQWKPRYAILSPHEGTMRYYSDNSQSKLLGAIDLTQAYVTVQEVRVRKSAFQITTSVRSWWFAASTDQDRDEWIKAVKDVLEEKKLLQSTSQTITKLLGFGSNNLGQLGHLRTSTDKFAAIPADSLTSLAVGDSFCLATTTNGTMFAWGWAASGRLCVKADEDDSATGAASARKSLVKPPPVQWQPRPVLPALFGNPSIRITQVTCGAHNGFALSDAGAVFAWGRAGSTLGLGPEHNATDKHTPTAIGSFLNLKVLRISAYGAVASAVLDGGRLFMWGQSEFMESATFNSWEAQTPEFIDAFGGMGVHTLAIGEKHFLALLDNKQVCSWGSSDFGQLGHGSLDRQVKPRIIETLADTPIERVFAAPDYSLCISSAGKAFSWGNAANGTLGLALDTLSPQQYSAEKNCVVVPVPVESIRAVHRVKSIGAGRKSCLFLCEGTVYAAGENVFSQWAIMAGLGDKLLTPTALPIDFVCEEVAAGEDFVLVAQSDKPLDKRASVMFPTTAMMMLQKADSRPNLASGITPASSTEMITTFSTPPNEAPPTPPATTSTSPTSSVTMQPISATPTGTGSGNFNNVQNFFAPSGAIMHQPPGAAGSGQLPPVPTEPVSAGSSSTASPVSSSTNTPTSSVAYSSSPVQTSSAPTSRPGSAQPAAARADSRKGFSTLRGRAGAMDSRDMGGVSGLLDRVASLEAENERLKRELEDAMSQLRSTKGENDMLYTEISALRLQLPQDAGAPTLAPAPVQQTHAFVPVAAAPAAQPTQPAGPAAQASPALPFDGFTFD